MDITLIIPVLASMAGAVTIAVGQRLAVARAAKTITEGRR